MKSFMLFTLGSILFLLNACVGIYPCRKQFSLYKEPFNPSNTKFPIKTNGVYISVNHEGSLYLYNNGYAKILFSNLPEGKSFWKNPSIEIIEWFEREFVTEPNTFRLYETEHKPDSTLAWFSKKRWYKKNLHESRR
jgi:hypothetical protein